MILSTTQQIEGQPVQDYLGLVVGETISGANIFRDIMAGVRDVVGGRAQAYENVLRDARTMAIEDMCEKADAIGANAILAIDLDYEAIGRKGSMLMVTACGTAVRL